ncbi:MAG: Kelch repeat-containing protein [Polyangiaceae bacterium]
MKLGLITFLTVSGWAGWAAWAGCAGCVAGCSSSAKGAAGGDGGGGDGGGAGDDAGPGADAAGTDAGEGGAGDDASQGTTPTWTAFASRGSDSRWGVPLAYAGKEGAFLAFGGSQYPTVIAAPGTFSLSMSTGQWTQLTDVTPPAPRYCGCATYLPDRDQVLLIGGQDGAPMTPAAFTLDLATSAWTAVSGAVPAGAIGCMTAYMPGIGKAVVFGGLSSTAMTSDTWLYDPVAATFTKAAPATHPPARADGIAAYDPGDGGRMLLFAGTSNEVDATGHMNDLWAFDGTSWTQLQPSGGPPSVRRVPAGGFDAQRRRWVVFGGTDETADRGDLWLLDVASLTWTQLDAAGTPPARGFASAGYDPGTDSYVVVGGLAQPSDQTLSDGWKLELR